MVADHTCEYIVWKYGDKNITKIATGDAENVWPLSCTTCASVNTFVITDTHLLFFCFEGNSKEHRKRLLCRPSFKNDCSISAETIGENLRARFASKS